MPVLQLCPAQCCTAMSSSCRMLASTSSSTACCWTGLATASVLGRHKIFRQCQYSNSILLSNMSAVQFAAPALDGVLMIENGCSKLGNSVPPGSASMIQCFCRAGAVFVPQLVGRALAATLGIGLILVQVLSHYNYITVNWSVVHKQARQVLDTTGDG